MRTLDLVCIKPRNAPVYFVVQGHAFMDDVGSRDDDGSKAYYYEDHTCPVNVLPCEEIIFEGNADPHGLIAYVASADKPAGWEEEERKVERLEEMFPQAFGPRKKAIS